MKRNFRSFLVLAAAPALLAACANPVVLDRSAAFPNQSISEPSRSQMVAEASGRQRVRDLRAEVVGNIRYLQSHLGESRSHILDMNDSLLVTLPGRGAFQGGTSRLTEDGIDSVARIAASMIAYPHTRITIAGHVEGTTSAFTDQIMSERRAMAVKSVLMSRGIDECRIGLMGKGSDDHVAAPVTDRQNQYNDRIEVMIMPFQDGACV